MKLIYGLVFLASLQSFAGTIEIMSYNVENLFDTIHDFGKEDWTFLPKNAPGKQDACKKIKSDYRRKECFSIDWTDKKLDLKLDKIKDVLTKHRAGLPDIVGLIEIENQNVVQKLADKVGYKKLAVANSPDERGIDVAVMYNESADLKYVKHSEIVLRGNYFSDRPTRNILEVEFEIQKKYKLHIFVNHWPSLGNPDIARELAAKALKKRIDEILKSNKDAHILAMGDFNTIDKLKKPDSVHPFSGVLLNDGVISAVHTKYQEKMKDVKSATLMPPGTYYYDRGGEWNMLDQFFANASLLDGKDLDIQIESYQIYAPEFLKQPVEMKERDMDKSLGGGFSTPAPSADELMQKGYPKRYDHEKSNADEVGYSDHFPIVLKLSF